MSVLTSLLSGGMTTVYKYLAIGGAVLAIGVGAFFYGVHTGSADETAAVAQAAANQNAKTVVTVEKQTVVDTSAVEGLSTQLAKVNGTNAKLQAQLKQLQESQLTTITPATPTAPATCQLSPSWVQLYNSSLGTTSKTAKASNKGATK